MHQPQQPKPITLTARNLTCVRDQHQVFTDIGFSILSGQVLFLRGPNGAGKTSLLMILAGLLPFSGKLDFGLTDEQHNQTLISEHIHFIGHLNAMKPQLTLTENLQFWATLCGGISNSIQQALQQAGLAGLDNFEAGHLSTGQKHRLSLARLLVSPRPIWLLDEPSSALDAKGDQWISSIIEHHVLDGGLVITATHRSINLPKSIPQKTLHMEHSI